MTQLTSVFEHSDYKASIWHQFNSVQSRSRVRLFETPWIAARQASLSITNSRSSYRLTSIESVMPSNHLMLCRPLFLLPPIPPSIRVFSNESTLRMRWPKSTGVSALASFLPKKSQGWSPSEWIVGSPCSPGDSQASSPTPQFKSINSSVHSFICSPTSHIQGYCYHLSKFHIYALVYCIGVFLSGLPYSV